MRRLSLSLLVAALLAAAPHTAPSSSITYPYQGLTYIDEQLQTPRVLHTHVIQVDLAAPGVRVLLTPPDGPRETRRETTAAFVARVHAQAGINGHFFLPFPTDESTAWLVGFAASDGRVFSAFEHPEQNFALVDDAPAVNIDPQRHASIVHRDDASPGGLRVKEPVTVWTAIAGSAQIVTDGVVTIPQYRDATHPDAALSPGTSRKFANGNSWYDVLTARSALGVSRDGRTLTLFTGDVRSGSEGLTIGEAARLLIDRYHVWNALNLDGGGSTSLALADPKTGVVSLVNTSSDNPAGRSVGSSLAIFARPTGARGASEDRRP